MTIETQVVVVYAATKGFLDKVELSSVAKFEELLLSEVSTSLLEELAREKSITAGIDDQLQKLCKSVEARIAA
jgi:F0F1-type ATP synthase alpha subunit